VEAVVLEDLQDYLITLVVEELEECSLLIHQDLQ
jgi:hypothetical protein